MVNFLDNNYLNKGRHTPPGDAWGDCPPELLEEPEGLRGVPVGFELI